MALESVGAQPDTTTAAVVNTNSQPIDPNLLAALATEIDTVEDTSGSSTIAPANANDVPAIALSTTGRLPVPQGYVVAASYTLTPEALLQLPDSGLPTGTKILVAGIASADAVNSGNFGDAFTGSTLFISIKVPGTQYATVATWNPSSGSVEIGQGLAQPFNLGVVNGAFFGNYRGNPLAVTPGGDLDAVTSANAGVLIGSPALNAALNGALSNAIRRGGQALAGALAASGFGAGFTLPAAFVGELLARVANTGAYFIGAAYRASISADGSSITVQGPGGTTDFTYEEFIKTALGDFTYDNRNFGIPEVAYAKNQWQLANGSSYFQLSAASGGWSFINDTAGNVVEAVPRKNFGDPGLGLINYLNVWGQAVAQQEGPNATSPLTYVDLTPPPDENGLPSRYYVREFQNIDSGGPTGTGRSAIEVAAYLRETLSDEDYAQFIEGLRPLAEPLGLNLGLPELNPVDPATPELQQAREYLDRDWLKNSEPRDTRGIQEIPQEIYDQIRADLGLDQVASDGTGVYLYPDYISPEVPTTEPELAEIYPEGFEDFPSAGLTATDLNPDAPALAPFDGIIFEAGANGDTFDGSERNDVLYGAEGVDVLNGSEGDDLVIGNSTDDTLNGGAGNDIAAYLRSQTGVNIDLSNLSTVVDVESIGGSNMDDTIAASSTGPQTIYGFGGNDTITGADGVTIYGDYSPEFVDTYGTTLILDPDNPADPQNIPEGNDEIDATTMTTGAVYAGGGDDSVRVSGRLDGTTVVIEPTLDGGDGTDTLTVVLSEPLPDGVTEQDVIDQALALPNVTNFENIEVEVDAIPIELPSINSASAVNTAPDGWTISEPSPDIIDGNGPWPGGGWVASDISADSPFGNTMALSLSNTAGVNETISTTLSGLMPGQTYSFQVAWQQATLTNPNSSTTYSGGALQVAIDGEEQIFSSEGGAGSDDWQIETVTFTATSETATVELGIQDDSTFGAIVIDTPEASEPEPDPEPEGEPDVLDFNYAGGTNDGVVYNASLSDGTSQQWLLVFPEGLVDSDGDGVLESYGFPTFNSISQELLIPDPNQDPEDPNINYIQVGSNTFDIVPGAEFPAGVEFFPISEPSDGT